MYLVMFTARPKRATLQGRNTGGAYVNCWVNTKNRRLVEKMAQKHIEKSGWNVVSRQTKVKLVSRAKAEEDQEMAERYVEAMERGGSYVFYCWPGKAQPAI